MDTNHSNFGPKTEATTVAAAFSASIKDRTIVITGVNKLGIGYATAQALAAHSPRQLIICGRSVAKLDDCASSLRSEYNTDVRTVELDLSSQQAVRRAAAEILNAVATIDILINNAGIMNIPTRMLSPEAIELHLATNHVGHFLLTNLLMPRILAAASSSPRCATRIINVSSMATFVSPFRASDPHFSKSSTQLPPSEAPNLAMMKMALLDVNEDMSYIPMAAYGQSKTANILYSVALNTRLLASHGVLSLALHPGEVMSELQRSTDTEWFEKTLEWKKKIGLEYKTPMQGAATTVVVACDPALVGEGVFLADCGVSGKVPDYALDGDVAEGLWGMSEGWVGEGFAW